MRSTEQQIADYLNLFNQDIATLAQRLRVFLTKETKPAIELVGDSTLSVNIGYGFTEKAWDCFCAIIVYSKHINISFPAGALLNDPEGLLQGTGKKIRHIRINDFQDITKPSVQSILKEARNRALSLAGENKVKHKKTKTIIKPIAGIKKRPNQVN